MVGADLSNECQREAGLIRATLQGKAQGSDRWDCRISLAETCRIQPHVLSLSARFGPVCVCVYIYIYMFLSVVADIEGSSSLWTAVTAQWSSKP